MKKLFSLVLVLLAFVLVACDNTGEVVEVARDDQFIVGMEADYQPFNWTENTPTPYNHPINNFEGKYADGYDVQIAKAVAASLGKVLVIEKLAWEALIVNLQEGNIDAIIAGMSPTEDRKESVSFTNGYYESVHVVVVKTDGDYSSATKLTDFTGATIIGQQGTVYDDLVPQLVGATHGVPLATVPEILNSILAGRSDGTIVELPVAKGIVEVNPELKYIEFTDEFVVDESDKIVSIAVALGEDELVERINAILAAITDEVRINLMDQAIGRAPVE